MTPARFTECLAALRMTQRGLARGRNTIPETVAAWLEAIAAAHERHPPPIGFQTRVGNRTRVPDGRENGGRAP